MKKNCINIYIIFYLSAISHCKALDVFLYGEYTPLFVFLSCSGDCVTFLDWEFSLPRCCKNRRLCLR